MMTTILRYAVAPISLVFAGLGLQFIFAPEAAARAFGLEAAGAAGLVSLRADLGGLFVGLALLCWAAAWTKRRTWLFAAALVLVAIASGRSIGWLVDGVADGELARMAVELGAAGTLLGAIRTSKPPSPPKRHRFKAVWIAAGVVGLLAATVGVVLFSPAVQAKLFAGAAEKMTATVNTAILEDDALRVLVVGSSAPLPSAERAKASVAVFAAGKFWVVDIGPEATENLLLWNVPMSKIGGVLLTHFHSDHIGDLGELQLQTWAGGRREKLAVYGGPGVERVVAGFNEAYALDQGYRTKHHGEEVMPSKTWGMVAHAVELDGEATPKKDRTGLVLDEDGLRITAIEVDHAPIEPAYAYRFDYKGRSVVVSGDLKDHQPLAVGAAGADILISEAIATRMTRALGTAATNAGRKNTAAIMHDIEDYHITPEQAAKLANNARVKLLVFYHLLPSPDGPLARRFFAQGVDEVRQGDWTIAADGSLYTLPFGSPEIETSKLER
jgi:ribonuclease Z